MIDPFEHKGVWYLPESPDEKIGGTLKFSPDEGITLDLVGSFTSFNLSSRRETQVIVLGSTLSGKDVTLSDCYIIDHSYTTNRSLTAQSYRVTRAFFGPHFSTPDEIRFKEIQTLILGNKAPKGQQRASDEG